MLHDMFCGSAKLRMIHRKGWLETIMEENAVPRLCKKSFHSHAWARWYEILSNAQEIITMISENNKCVKKEKRICNSHNSFLNNKLHEILLSSIWKFQKISLDESSEIKEVKSKRLIFTYCLRLKDWHMIQRKYLQ